MKRAAVFAHYDRDNMVDDYVVHYLRSLREVCANLVFVSTSDLPENETSKVDSICDRVVVRENLGYDFMSYKVGLGHLAWDDYDEVVLCNDSVYGPLFQLNESFDKMQRVECDFWGMTESRDRAYHLQSYFLVFREKVLQSSCFKNFWENITTLNNKSEIIDRFEVGLSQSLVKNGFRPGVYVSFSPGTLRLYRALFGSMLRKKIYGTKVRPSATNKKSFIKKIGGLFEHRQLGNNLNPTHFFWIDIINNRRMPFIKVELLRDNPMYINIRDFEFEINKLSDYDISYIKRHLARVGKHPPPDTSRTGAGGISR